MSQWNPGTLAELTRSIGGTSTVHSQRFGVRAGSIQVLSSGHDVFGYLGAQVDRTQADYRERYLERQGAWARARFPHEVRYYVAALSGHVYAVVLNNGQIVTDFPADLSRVRRDAIEVGLATASDTVTRMGSSE